MAERKSILWRSKGLDIDLDTIENGNPTKDNLADILLNISKDKITFRFIFNTFGTFDDDNGNPKSLANPYDLFEVPEGKFSYFTDKEKTKSKSNKNTFTTTIGIFILNIFLRDFNFSRLFDGYFQDTLSKKKYGNIEQVLSYALIEDKITVEDLKQWENTMQWFMPFETILSPNHTEKMITCTKAINKKKEELVKKYKDRIEAGDAVIAEQIEQELLNFAKEYLGDDPSLDTILSDASGDFDNNFKNMFVMKGAVQDPDPTAKQKYHIVTGNYMDGIPANEYPIVAGSGVHGAYARGKKTEVGGYYEKLFISAYQTIKLDPPGSDCGTNLGITVNLTEKNIADYMYCYVMKPNGDLELIDTSTRSKYIGKKVKLRFASMCQSKTGICNKCAGELFYRLNEKYIGIALAQIPDTMKLRCMKGFHNATIQYNTMDVGKAFYPWDDE